MSVEFAMFWASSLVFLVPGLGHWYFNALGRGRASYNTKVGCCVAAITFLLLYMARAMAAKSQEVTMVPTVFMLIFAACIIVFVLPQEN